MIKTRHRWSWFFAAGAISIASSDVAVYKMGYTILVGWTWEWPLFGTFLIVRVFDVIRKSRSQREFDQRAVASRRVLNYYKTFVLYGTPGMILVYFATRVLETIYLGMLVACAIQRNATTGPFIAMSAIMCTSVVLQFYAGYILVIFTLRRRRILAKEEKFDGSKESTAADKKPQGKSKSITPASSETNLSH